MSDSIGAVHLGESRCRFRVWAPHAETVELRVCDPEERIVRLEPRERGYHEAVVDGVPPGARYLLRLDDELERPDPASRYQPEGVHGPSAVVAPDGHRWQDHAWHNLPLHAYAIYELHAGTYTEEGTLDAAIAHLDELRDLGVTAVEVMPVAQFPGARNWGYDGVFPYAVQDSYGGPDALKRFVDACHARGLAAILDVVYNHVGPEGAYFDDFGPYFTEKYRTPWGRALNFDGPGSDEVRRYFIDNALRWLEEFHFDALRLDAVHGIFDQSARHFLLQLSEEVSALAGRVGRPLYLIAESDLNDPRIVTEAERGGLGMHAQWADDFHHAVHALLTGERDGYYADYGTVEDVAKALREGFVYDGRYSAYRGRTHGAPAPALPAERFVFCVQNHDQVGNRMLGERLAALVGFEALKLAAGCLLLSPFVPLLFMGEEYGERAPFLYFVSHTDGDLIEAVRNGRREEFAAFEWSGEPPDPQAEETFRRSRLDRGLANGPEGAALRDLYRELLALRRSTPALARSERDGVDATADDTVLTLHRRHAEGDALAVFNFGEVGVRHGIPEGTWDAILDSAAPRWRGPGSAIGHRVAAGEVAMQPLSFVLLVQRR